MKWFTIVILLVSIACIDGLDKEKDCKCRSSISERIVGGHKVKDQDHEYPWLVSLRVVDDPSNESICAATILNENTLLTAAVCGPKPFVEEKISRLAVYVRGGAEELVQVESIIKHPNYIRPGIFVTGNDIAIVKLKKSLNFTAQVQPGCLDFRREEIYYNLKVAGSGSITPVYSTNDLQLKNITSSNVLKDGTVFDKTHNLCVDRKPKVICRVSFDTQVCIGDTGTGLMTNRNGRTYIVGVAAMPFNLLNEDKGIVEICKTGTYFTRLSYYQSFVEKHVGDNYCHS